MSKCNKRIANQQKYIGNEVVNHKVEQIIRAIVVPNNGGNVFEYLHPVSTHHTIQGMLGAMDIVEVGSAVGGWTFHPDTNSALIMLGLNPSAVLLRLNSVVIEDVPALVESGGRLVAPFSAVVAVAYECSYSGTYKHVQHDYEAYTRYNGGVPKHFKSAQYKSKQVGA